MTNVYERLIKKAKELGINIEFVQIERLAFYMAESRTIFLNSQLVDENAGAFHMSHELGHYLNDHNSYKKYYYATSKSMAKMEYEANEIAIELLLEFYLEDCVTEKEQINPIKFMETFNISSYLENCVTNSMKKLCATMC